MPFSNADVVDLIFAISKGIRYETCRRWVIICVRFR